VARPETSIAGGRVAPRPQRDDRSCRRWRGTVGELLGHERCVVGQCGCAWRGL